MVPPAFDTHKAVKSLTVAGFSDSKAEAVVAIRSDLDSVLATMLTKADLVAFERRMTIKFGAMMLAGTSFLAVLQKVC